MERYTGTKSERQADLSDLSKSEGVIPLLRYAVDVVPERKPHKLKRDRKKWSRKKITSVCSLRLGDIRRIIVGTFGGPCDSDDSELFFDQALPHLVARHVAYGKLEEAIPEMLSDWAWKHTRRVATEHSREWFREQADRILTLFDNDDGFPSIPDGDDVSRALGVRQTWVEEFRLQTLAAVERPRRVREAETRARKADRERQRRLENGATPHAESREALAPWKVHGISRSTCYRTLAKGEIVEMRRRNKAERPAAPCQPPLRLVSST